MISPLHAACIRISQVLITVSALFVMAPEAKANNLAFPETPVKQATIDGNWVVSNAKQIDPGKGCVYRADGKPNELGVIVLDAAISQTTKQILSGNPGVLAQAQQSELGKSENPWILRYCAERGKPELSRVNNKTFLLTDFSQEGVVRIATEKGAMCARAGKLEAHAFTLAGNKLVHIFLVQNIPSDTGELTQDQVKKRFSMMLQSIKW